MSFLARLAPELIPIPREGPFDDDEPSPLFNNFPQIQEFPYSVSPYASQLKEKIHAFSKIDSLRWRVATLSITAIDVIIIPFYLVESALAGVCACLALAHTRDLNDHQFRHLTCWTADSMAGILMGCLSPFACVFMLLVGEDVKNMFQDFKRWVG